MLSYEADALTRLILARQMLICRALELDIEAEVLAVTGPAVCSWETFHAVYAELALVPGLIENLDVEISVAQRRLKAAWRPPTTEQCRGLDGAAPSGPR
jgi:hypothetical protein